jgi:hypothetical protein
MGIMEPVTCIVYSYFVIVISIVLLLFYLPLFSCWASTTFVLHSVWVLALLLYSYCVAGSQYTSSVLAPIESRAHLVCLVVVASVFVLDFVRLTVLSLALAVLDSLLLIDCCFHCWVLTPWLACNHCAPVLPICSRYSIRSGLTLPLRVIVVLEFSYTWSLRVVSWQKTLSE